MYCAHFCSEFSCYELSLSYPVPEPDVEVTVNRTTTLYAGTGLSLTCTVTLNSNVDSGESVVTSWSGPRTIPGEQYSVTEGSEFEQTVTISLLADQDDGTYTCTVAVTGGSNVLQATASHEIIITVMGE